MMRILPFLSLFAIQLAASPLKTLTDRPGLWEAEWIDSSYAAIATDSGRFSVRSAGGVSEHPGDLAAPRLFVTLALPAEGDWNLEISDKESIGLSARPWRRVDSVDAAGNRHTVAPNAPPDREILKTGGIRLLRLNLPLVALGRDGSLQCRSRLHLRLTSAGSARPRLGTTWERLVANPGAIQRVWTPSARGQAKASRLPDEKTVVITVGDRDAFTELEDGLVRISGQALYSLSSSAARSLSFSHLALLSGTGDTVSIFNDTLPRPPGLRLLAFERTDKNRDGILDNEDEIRFWVRGTGLWKWNPDLQGQQISHHPYDLERRYYLQLQARDSSPEPLAPRQAPGYRAFGGVSAFQWLGKPDRLLEPNLSSSDADDLESGKGWYWADLRKPRNVSLDSLGLPPLPALASDTGFLTIHGPASYGVRTNIWELNVERAGEVATHQGDGDISRFRLTGLTPGRSNIVLRDVSGLLLTGVSLETIRSVSGQDSAVFPAPALGSIGVPVRDGRTCWVLEDGALVRRCSIEGGMLRDSVSNPNTWYALFPSQALSKGVSMSMWRSAGTSHAISDLTTTAKYDLVVVTPDEFLSVAEDYASWRENPVQVRPMKVGILRTRDIWAGWSGGSQDPAAVRDALRWAATRWGTSHALLLGAGSVDARGMWPSSRPNWVPQWEDHQIATDDFFGWFDEGMPLARSVLGIGIGRAPVTNLAEAKGWLAKVKTFEDPARASWGSWRNSVVLVADDQYQSLRPDNMRHSEQIEEMSNKIKDNRPWTRQVKIFENSYPRTANFTKPDVRRDLVRQLNDGVVGFCFIGHGSEAVLTDEIVMDEPTFRSAVSNPDRPWFFFAGSCSVGRNDRSTSVGLGAAFVNEPGKGAFATIAGTRATLSDNNGVFGNEIMVGLMDSARQGRTMAEALQYAKLNGRSGNLGGYRNSDLYNLLGDPALVMFPGGLDIHLDSLPDTLSQLQRLSISGSVSKEASTQVRVDHPLAPTVFTEVVGNQTVTASDQQIVGVTLPGPSKTFASTFLLPAKLPIGDSALVKVYSWDPRTRRDGGMVSAPRLIYGTGKEIPSDATGPKIGIRPCDSSWTGGIEFGKVAKIPLPFCMEIQLEDSSGISTDLGPDEGVLFSIPGVAEPWHPDINQGDGFQTATARLSLDSSLVQAGKTYTLRVGARDLMGNLARADLRIEPQVRGEYNLYELYASPNPVRDDGGVSFRFKISSEPDSTGGTDTRIQSAIRIHTVTGKLVRVLRTDLSGPGLPRPRADWDLRDAFGVPVGNGIYPYTITLRIPDPSETGTRELMHRGIIVVAR
ncbi:MAG: hypothetical protein IPK50_23055 [Fibrobacterota bacterium]|nr:hypothetical protein [Fibrobacterota bacterium]QQS05116.1 MAG: hypothetical protein IPK50_23055 [Fibrobacterota bacterium]